MFSAITFETARHNVSELVSEAFDGDSVAHSKNSRQLVTFFARDELAEIGFT
jgi:hypothetical protein